MYNIDFECKYYLETSDDLYRSEILKAFEMDDMDDMIINEKINTLYYQTKDYDFVTKSIDKLKNNKELSVFLFLIFQDGGDEAVFRLLFNYDYFHLFHAILCHYIRHKNTNEELFKNLLNKI